MGTQSTYLMDVVQEMISTGLSITQYKITVHIYTGSEWITPLAVHNYYLYRDYEGSFADTELLTVQMGLGDYAFSIYPNRDQLLIEVTSEAQVTNSGAYHKSEPIVAKRYRGVLLTQTNPALSTAGGDITSKEDLNQLNLISVEFQLLDEANYQVRMATVGRNYRNVTPMEVLVSALTENRTAVVANSEQLIHGVDVAPGYNETKRSQICIKPTRLTDLVAVLQDKEGGLYSAGAGCYLQDGMWFIYPLYNMNLIGNYPRTLTIVMLPPRLYQGEHTYMVSGESITIISNGTAITTDQGLAEQIDQSNGYRFINANNLMTATTTDNNTTALDRSKNLYEFSGGAFSDSANNLQWGKRHATSNPFPYYTELAKRSTRPIRLQWNYADPSLLTPGMPVRIVTASEDKIVSKQGTLLYVEANRTTIDHGPIKEHFSSNVTLGINIKREGI